MANVSDSDPRGGIVATGTQLAVRRSGGIVATGAYVNSARSGGIVAAGYSVPSRPGSIVSATPYLGVRAGSIVASALSISGPRSGGVVAATSQYNADGGVLGGVRSLLAFWMGGASAVNVEVDPCACTWTSAPPCASGFRGTAGPSGTFSHGAPVTTTFRRRPCL